MATEIGKALIPVAFDKASLEGDAQKNLVPGVKRIAENAARVWAAAKIFEVGKAGLAELGEAQKVMSQTTATIKATGGAANLTADQVAQLSGRLSDMSAVDDEVIQQGANMLLTFKAVRNEVGEGNDVFDKATEAALDLSAAGFGSMESASVMLGKALQDPLKGITALGRAGVTFSEDQKSAIAAMVESGDLLGAQKIILGEVEAQVGGVAAAYGDTLPGKLDRANNAMDEAKASMVGGLAPALEIGASAATFLAEQVAGLPEPLQAVVGITALVGGGIGSMIRPVSDLVNAYSRWRTASVETAAAVAATTAAQNSAASVSTLYAGKTRSLSSTLGKAGVAGAATLAVGALYAYGQSLNNTKVFADDFAQAATRASDAQIDMAAQQLLAFTQVEGTLGIADQARAKITELAEAGEAGTGVLRKMRDAVAAAGGDTTLFDQALQSAADSQANLNANTKVGSGALNEQADALELTEEQLEAAGKAAETFAGFQGELADAMDRQYQSMFTNVDLISQYEGSVDSLTEALGKNGYTLDLHEKSGRDNLKALQESGQAIADLIEMHFKETGSLEEAIGWGDKYVQNLRDQLENAGYNKDQIEEMITQIGLTPEQMRTTFSSNAAEAEIVVAKYINALDEIPPQVQSDIEALINQGKLKEANEAINNLAQGRTIDFTVQLRGGGQIYTTDSRTGITTSEADITVRNVVQRARGGPVGPGEMFRGAEEGWEILFHDGVYQAPPSGGYVMPHDQSEMYLSGVAGGAGGGLNFNGPTYFGSDREATMRDLNWFALTKLGI